MLPEQRRERILQVVEQKGYVTLQELVSEVGVSESTVRRDLEYLEGIRQVRRTRGGAAYVGESLTAFEDRRMRALPQKQRIARKVAELVAPGEAVLMDGGTTTLEVARQLLSKPLQIVTNSLPIVNLVVNQPQIELIVIGGYLYPKTGVALGPHAEQMLESLHARRLIMSVGGITERGLFNSNALLVATERRMMQAADEVVVVADSSKFGHTALAHLCPLDAVDCLVVDPGIPDEWKQKVEAAGVRLIIA